MIGISSSGSFKGFESFAKKITQGDVFASLERYGQAGVAALAAATPKDSGLTAASWRYEVKRQGKSYSIVYSNTHIVNGAQIAILLQYGHGTGTGGWVEGRDYINPAARPVFDKIVDEVWKVVTNG